MEYEFDAPRGSQSRRGGIFRYGGAEQAARVALRNPHWDELALGAGWVAAEGASTLGLRKRRREIVGREDGDRAGLLRRFVHLEHEVRAGKSPACSTVEYPD